MERYCRHRHLANELYGALSLAATTVLLHGNVWDKARRQSFDSRGARYHGRWEWESLRRWCEERGGMHLTRQGGGRVICMLDSLAAAKSEMCALQHILIALIIFRAFRVPVHAICFTFLLSILRSRQRYGIEQMLPCHVMHRQYCTSILDKCVCLFTLLVVEGMKGQRRRTPRGDSYQVFFYAKT
jgi:hypothetical protein